MANVDAAIVRLFTIGVSDFERAKKLKVVAKHGAGLDNINCIAATRFGIPVLFTPGTNSNAVAEHTLGLMLSLSRKIDQATVATKGASQVERSVFQGVEIAGKTIGIIGLGRIGSKVACKAAALDMNVVAYDPYIKAELYDGPAKIVSKLEELFCVSDYLTLHVPSTEITESMINKSAINKLKRECYIINTCRGTVIDENALIDALKEKRIAGAALDVFREEPLPANHPFTHAPNIILTPHIAGVTNESMKQVSIQVAEYVLRMLNGEIVEDIVNPEVLKSRKT